MTPMPPSRASAIARRASLTVSIAAERMGILSVMSAVSRVLVQTSPGSTLESSGTSKTSSNVNPSLPNFHCHASSVVMCAHASLILSRRKAYKKRPAHGTGCHAWASRGLGAVPARIVALSTRYFSDCTAPMVEASISSRSVASLRQRVASLRQRVADQLGLRARANGRDDQAVHRRETLQQVQDLFAT